MEQKRGILNRYFFPRDNNPEHFKALDGLRGVAVLIVMLSHASNMHIHLFNVLDFKQTGRSGVFLFFILSAYLLDRQIAIAMKNKKADIRYWANYLFRRFMRIYPLFFAALVFNYWLRVQGVGVKYGIVMTGWYEIFQHLTLQKLNGIFWSIGVEFKYYFISPFILLFISRFIKWHIVNVILLIITTIALVSFFTLDNNSISFNLMPIYDKSFHIQFSKSSTFPYLPIFLIGTIISLIEVFSSAFEKMSDDDRKKLDIIGIIAILIFILTFRSVFGYLMYTNKNYLDQKGYYISFSLLWATILIATKYSKGILRAIFSFKPLRFIGVISFSLYLFHWPVLKFAALSGYFPASTQIYVFILLSILVATFTFVLIEKPFSKLKLKKKPKLT